MTEERKTGYDMRTILDEMRNEYWQGLAEADEVPEEHLECITFTIGGEAYAFEITFATEVIRVPKLVPLPRVQESIAGVFNLRGEIIAAMDIRPLLGLPRPELTTGARIIVVKAEKFQTGLITEGVRGAAALPYSSFAPAVKSLEAGAREFIRGQVNLDGNIVVLLDVPALLASPGIIVNHQ
jgi:purine-binding chemotaxis protein CheW